MYQELYNVYLQYNSCTIDHPEDILKELLVSAKQGETNIYTVFLCIIG